MTKEEKAVLAACDSRMTLFMKNYGYSSWRQVMESQRGLKTPQAKLIRAVARWCAARKS